MDEMIERPEVDGTLVMWEAKNSRFMGGRAP